MKRYAKYEDSGVEWVGEIPAHWESSPLKYLASFYGGGTPDKSNEAFWKGEIPWVSPKDMHVDYVVETEDHISEEAVTGSSTKMVAPGAVLVVVRSGILRHTLPVATNAVPVALNQDMKAIVAGDRLDPDYLRYFIKGSQGNLLMDWRKQGATVESIEQENLANCPIPLPPLDEQRQLAAYLDCKTAEVDTLIRKKKALIARLGELRAALIHRAVTKGLDPAVPMKDSGVKWLGEIPQHWTIPQLKYTTQFVNGAAFKPAEWASEGVPIIRISNLNGDPAFNHSAEDVEKRYHVREGDLLFAWSGNRGTSFGPFLWARQGLHYLNQHIFRLEEYDYDTRYFYWMLKTVTTHVEEQAHGIIGMVHITKGDLGAIRVPEMLKAEQRAIARHLDKITGQIDSIVEREGKLIDHLRELRTSLIFEIVTGKIDVRAVPVANHAAAADATEANAFLWWVLANYVLGQMAHADRFGRITLVKVLFVLIYELRLRLTDKKYRGPHERWDFGPHDPEMTHALEASLEREGYWKKVKVPDERQVRYVPGPNADDPKGHFDKYWGNRKAEIDRVIGLFTEVTSHGRAAERAEIVATLYGAWNDLLLDGASPSDDEIVREARENWHPHKLTIAEERWRNGLVWMREHGLVPTGFGDPVVAREVAA